jgi:hypothetical protein
LPSRSSRNERTDWPDKPSLRLNRFRFSLMQMQQPAVIPEHQSKGLQHVPKQPYKV